VSWDCLGKSTKIRKCACFHQRKLRKSQNKNNKVSSFTSGSGSGVGGTLSRMARNSAQRRRAIQPRVIL
jgi:hypothetical protein